MTDQVNTNVTDGKIMTDYSAGDFHCILLASNFSDLGCEFGELIVTSPRLPGAVWVGQIWDYEFKAWYKVATATPPQEYDLPLAEGWSGTAKYYKTQVDVCVVFLDISKASVIATGEHIATMPMGYRPSYTKMSPASIFAPSGSTTIGVSTDGSILLGDVFGQEQARNVYATIAFIAN